MAYKRIAVIRQAVEVPGVPGFRLSGSANYDGDTPVGAMWAGPPAWTPQTEYFQGNFAGHEEMVNGNRRLFYAGTLGGTALASREPESLIVTIDKYGNVLGLLGAYAAGVGVVPEEDVPAKG